MKTVILIAGFTIAIASGGCGSSNSSAGPQALDKSPANLNFNTEYVAAETRGVRTMKVQETAVPEYLELAAHVETDPTRVVRVFAPAGGRITEMKVRPWEIVEQGQTLAVLESGDLARGVAEYRKALADNQVKQEGLARSRDLFEHHAVSEKDYQQAQGDAQVAQAEVDAAREQVQVFGMDPDRASTRLTVAAPRSGVILDVTAAPGEFSQALSAPAPMCTIADITTLWAVGDIYEKDLGTAKSGAEARVTLNAYPDQHWSGQVGVVSSAVDPATHTLHVRVLLPNVDGRIKPGMFGSIRLLKSSAQGILVPTTSVVREGNDAYVYVERKKGKFERRSVKLGRAVDGTLEIVSGLSPGDTIVSEGALFLRADAQS